MPNQAKSYPTIPIPYHAMPIQTKPGQTRHSQAKPKLKLDMSLAHLSPSLFSVFSVEIHFLYLTDRLSWNFVGILDYYVLLEKKLQFKHISMLANNLEPKYWGLVREAIQIFFWLKFGQCPNLPDPLPPHQTSDALFDFKKSKTNYLFFHVFSPCFIGNISN